MPHKPGETAQVRLMLDTRTLEKYAESLPDELKDPFLWLGTYVREECSREAHVLEERAKKLGIAFDQTTWSRILRGLWNRDARGNVLEHPIVAAAKLLKAIDALRKDARIREQSGRFPFIETPTTRMIFNYIDTRRAADRICKFGVIIGETGTQKTTACEEYCRQNNHGSCVLLQSPENGSITRLRTDWAEKYGKDRRCGNNSMIECIEECFNDRKTVILENIQWLYDPRRGAQQPIFIYLQKLQETRKGTIILTFTPDFEREFTAGVSKGFFEQFVGRVGGVNKFLRLEKFPTEEDVAAILEGVKMKDADKHVDFCVELVHQPGRIRVLMNALQEAKVRAEAKREALNIDHLKWAVED